MCSNNFFVFICMARVKKRNFLGIANIFMCLFEHFISKWVEMVQCVSRKTLKLISWCNVMSRSGHECKNILSVGRLLIDIECLLCLSFNYPPQPNLHCKNFSYIIFVQVYMLLIYILFQLHIVFIPSYFPIWQNALWR